MPSSFRIASYAVLTILLAYSVAMRAQLAATSQLSGVLDLTEKAPPAEQGFPGIPGASFGGPVGAKDTSRYQLPLEIQILGVSSRNKGDFAIEIAVRNAGSLDFDLPSSRNLTSVEKPGNKSQRLFFFNLRPVTEKRGDAERIEVIATGGSASVPNSFTRLAPGETLRVLLPASGETVKRAFKDSAQHVDVRVVCNEWQLEESRYFIRASSDEAASKNIIEFVLRDGQPVAQRP